DADRERPLETAAPAGFAAQVEGQPAGGPAAVAPDSSLEICLRLTGRRDAVCPGAWQVAPDGDPVPLVVAHERAAPPGADAVVAIDFGTRNTRVRLRWRRGLLPGKPPDTVDVIGDLPVSPGRPAAPWFSSEMVLHIAEKSFRWGTEAERHIRGGQLTPEEVVVRSLKTDLREGAEPWTEHRAEWTAVELLRRFFEPIVHRLDEHLRTADPQRPLSRTGMTLRYVVGRPVLDAREGDIRGRAYEEAVLEALARCGISREDVCFVHEPVAAAIGIARRREALLLGLPEGAAVAIVDSGGGTTDVALARPTVTGGVPSLDVIGSYSLRIGEGNPAIDIPYYPGRERREVGGNVLDHALAYRLLARPGDVLEADGRAVPTSLRPPSMESLDKAWVDTFVDTCRRMKERFAGASTLYLNRAAGEPRDPAEVLPFPNRPELAGVRLVHDLYDRSVAAPILLPTVEDLAARIAEECHLGRGARATDVRHVFYVGGTCVDPFVRQHYGRAFPLAPADADADAQGDQRIAERLQAVVDGAVWYGDQVFDPSPLALTVKWEGEDVTIVREGAALPPCSVATGRMLTCALDAGKEIEAELIASGGALPEPVTVARAFYRNETGVPEEVTFDVRVSREMGVTAELIAGGHREPQWRFALLRESP
ncbi:MAG TPA: hypothetical protein VLH79_13140, partial [Chthonomonadales bacterium]|nr:hypothetical protein [Chthonomonadales bacterium]